MLEPILVSGSVALILSVICVVAWRAGVRRVRAEEEKKEMVPDAIVGRDYRRIFHDIKSPLTAVRMSADLLLLGWDSDTDVSHINNTTYEVGEAINEAVVRILKLMESVSSPDAVQEVNVAEVVRVCVYIYGKKAPISVVMQDGATIVCVPILLNRLVGNILSNAVRHRTPNSLVTISGEYSGIGFCVANSIANEVDCNSIWENADPASTSGMGIIKSIADELGLDVVIRCVKNGVGNGDDHNWVFEAEVTW